MKRLIPLCLAAILVPSMASATLIVDDSFTDLDRTKTGALDADWWSSSSSSGNSVEIDGTGLGLISGTSGRGIHATFAPQTLGIGDTIVATITFTTPATVGVNKGGAFRFAMMDFNDSGLAADLVSSSSSVNPLYTNLPGYMIDFDINTDATADTSMREHLVNTTGRFLGTNGEWGQIGTGPDDGYTFDEDTEYVVVLSLTRTGADSMDIFGSLSQGASLLSSNTESDVSGIANNFGMFGIWANSDNFGSNTTVGDPDNGITLSNAKIEVLLVPEPCSAGLLLVGLLALGRSLKGRRA
jgi:hypothetical protein